MTIPDDAFISTVAKRIRAADEQALAEIFGRGDVAAAREFFDIMFFEGTPFKPGWKHLRTALLSESREMTQLLVTWGAAATEENLAELKHIAPEKYPRYAAMLRRCGLRPSKESNIAAPAPCNDSLVDDNAAPKAFIDDQFIDYRAEKIPKEWRGVLQAMQELGAPEAVIAGGALRDLFNGRAVKDVDIFVASRGSERKNKGFLKKAFRAAGLKAVNQVIDHGYGVPDLSKFPDPVEKTTAPSTDYWGVVLGTESRTQSWDIVAGPEKTNYNVIFIRDGAMEHLLHLGCVVEHFDFSLCQIQYDGKRLTSTPEYKQDVASKTIAWRTNRDTTKEHLERIVKKYPDWQLCEKSQRLLAEKSAPIVLPPVRILR